MINIAMDPLFLTLQSGALSREAFRDPIPSHPSSPVINKFERSKAFYGDLWRSSLTERTHIPKTAIAS